jgi:SAM-dependent methyltransferase
LRRQGKLAAKNNLSNIRFETGVAESLPFPDSCFDVVTTRRAAHHFKSTDLFLNEARRVLKENGSLGLVDMSPPEGTQEFFNKLEKIRDSTHATAYSPAEWREKVRRSGFDIKHCRVLSDPLTLESWLYPVQPGGDQEALVREALRSVSDEISQRMKIRLLDGKVEGWTKDRIVLIARKS